MTAPGVINFIDGQHLGRSQVIGVGLVGAGELALIDSGPDVCFAAIVAEIRRLGFRPEDVRHVLVTHIHLDHSGGAWRWVRDFGATVCVHPRGAAHLADPTKLVTSATKIFGADMPRLWGEVQPVPAEKIRVVQDGEEIVAGSTTFRVVESLGHASHHHAYWLERDRTLFAGDVCGVGIGEGPLLPPCPPPDINVEQWLVSLEKIQALRPALVWLTHFGGVREPAERLRELAHRLSDWSGWMRDQLRAGRSESEIVPLFAARVMAELRRAGVTEDGLRAYEQADPTETNVWGLARYWKRFHPENLE